MLIGVAATPQVAIPSLDYLLSSGHVIAKVITQPDKPAGRGRELSQSPVSIWASRHGIETIKPVLVDELIGQIEDLDIVLTIGYGKLLPKAILKLPKNGFLNLHFSLLPAYRGAAPVQRALENGESKSGVTVFALDEGMDTGPIYSQKQLDIERNWRAAELFGALAKLGISAVSEALAMVMEGKTPIAQSSNFSLAPKISKSEAEINWLEKSESIVRKIKAFTYQPGAWTLWRGERFKIHSAIESSEVLNAIAGTIQVRENRIYVASGAKTSLELKLVVPSGKREMSAAEWANGARIQIGELLG